MDWAAFFQAFPVIGWFAVFSLIILIGLFLYGLFIVLRTKNLKLKGFELANQTQKELYQSEGKNILGNQTQNAHNLLKQVWIDLYETGRSKFSLEKTHELFLLEDIARLIEDKLNYWIKNDLARNNITEKKDIELIEYSEAKAVGYYKAVKASLYSYNVQLPDYDLPSIMDEISIEDYKKLFCEIYFNARKIAGGIR